MGDTQALDSGTAGNIPVNALETVVIRFAGDSGDGMQLTGTRFSTESALFGNDIRTLPDFPAEIRAPAGTLAGVSAFQLSFSNSVIETPGDALDVLVAMNPAALKMNIADLKAGGNLIINTSQFTKKNFQKAGIETDPREDGSLEKYRLHAIDITDLTNKALDDLGMKQKQIDRCKNFFALGLSFWLYGRSIENTVNWLSKKFKGKDQLIEANTRALKAGYYYGETTEAFDVRYEVKPADIEPGFYRSISGNQALALGFISASQKCGMELFLGSYPITPASDILHALSGYKNYGVHTFQAEDEIAAVTSSIGAAFGGALALTTTSGPGLALKGEALGLAMILELPLVVVNVQRGGPSTGLPTKTEQADLLQALYGRNGEAPVAILAAKSASDCFATAYEACQLAVKYMCPVIVLTDGYLANGSEPWKVPDAASLPEFAPNRAENAEGFLPYQRDPETLSRPWMVPGMAGFEHRVGGLEKEHLTGGVSYDPANHEFMCRLRGEKIQKIQQDIPATEIIGEESGDLLILGWGSTYGAIRSAVRTLQGQGKSVAMAHIRHIHPLPTDIFEIMGKYKQVLLPEMNLGQLSKVLRAESLIDIKSLNKIQGQPFKEQEIVDKALELLDGKDSGPYIIPSIDSINENNVNDANVVHLH